MTHQIFISYSNEDNKDKKIAETVCTNLEQNAGKCWIAPRDIEPGTPYALSIVSAIKSSEVMVLILTKNVNTSEHVRREIELAVNEKIPIIPLRIEDVKPKGEMEYYLSSIHWLEATTPPLEQHLPILAEAIRKKLKLVKVSQPDAEIVYNTRPGIHVFTEETPIKTSKWRKLRVFISHAIDDYSLYRIEEVARFLESRKEISNVYYVEVDLIGNIDDWMYRTIPRCQLLIFIATDNSLNSMDCLTELRIALKNNIQIIPILGVNQRWEDLAFADFDISKEVGFAFDPMEFKSLCKDLYRYILGFKLALEKDVKSRKKRN